MRKLFVAVALVACTASAAGTRRGGNQTGKRGRQCGAGGNLSGGRRRRHGRLGRGQPKRTNQILLGTGRGVPAGQSAPILQRLRAVGIVSGPMPAPWTADGVMERYAMAPDSACSRWRIAYRYGLRGVVPCRLKWRLQRKDADRLRAGNVYSQTETDCARPRPVGDLSCSGTPGQSTPAWGRVTIFCGC